MQFAEKTFHAVTIVMHKFSWQFYGSYKTEIKN